METDYKEEFEKFEKSKTGEKQSFFLVFDLDFNTPIEPLFMLLDFLQAREIIGSVAFFETEYDEYEIIQYLREFYPIEYEGRRQTKNKILLIKEENNGFITGVPKTIPVWHKKYSNVYGVEESKNWDYKKSS
ncbi:MAG: hypothetical protein K8S87_10940 [Planctomycetes bacterium]|nr:hypothetical protein [Planctomycetota bacterium]